MNKSKNIRKVLGLTEEEMAAALNISKTQLIQYESGKDTLAEDADQLLDMFDKYVNQVKLTPAKIIPLSFEETWQTTLSKKIIKSCYSQFDLERQLHTATLKLEKRLADIKILGAKEFFARTNTYHWPSVERMVYFQTSKAIHEKEIAAFSFRLKILKYEEALLRAELEQTKSISQEEA